MNSAKIILILKKIWQIADIKRWIFYVRNIKKFLNSQLILYINVPFDQN